MAAALVSEEQLVCSICLEVFTDPVSTPCGHNFCKHCITKHWDHSELCQCPMCKQEFSCRPVLQVNTLVSEMVLQLRSQQDSVSPDLQASAAEVLCDVCTEHKHKALRSCLVCLLSSCQLHLQPHETVSHLKRHQLTEPVENMEERMCPKHDKLLELFCRTDNTCLCTICPLVEHKNHGCVFQKDEFDLRRSALQQTQTEVQHLVEQRQVKIQEMRRSLELSQEAVDRERAAGLQVFTTLIQCVQKRQKEFIEELQEKHRQTIQQTEDWITELEQEICELEKRSTDIQQLTASEDHLHFLQRVSSLKTTADMKDWTQVTLDTPSYEGSVDRAVVQLQTTLKEELNKLNKVQLKRLQQCAVDVTLDPDTAHPQLVLSEDLKQVHHDGVEKTLPDKPQRITVFGGVLGKQSYSSGRFYFEVQVKGKTRWDLGVAKESINRNKNDNLSPKNGFWTLIMRDGDKYRGCGGPAVSLSLASAPERVGVYVDYEQGLVSFYDVDTAALIYSFTDCTFTEKIYPYFSPCVNCEGKNSTPLIIIPVKENE